MPLGFEVVGYVPGGRHVGKVVLALGDEVFDFVEACPAYPNIKALGCPLHRPDIGGSWLISDAKKFAKDMSQ